MAIAVDYERWHQQPCAMAFAVGSRAAQRMTIANRSSDRRAMFKIQCTASRKFRVRPALAVLPPNASAVVTFLLSPQEREPCACKFLVVVREVDADDTCTGQTSDSDAEREMKMRWKRAERRDHESLLFSETVDVHIVQQQPRGVRSLVNAAEEPSTAPEPSPTTASNLQVRSPRTEESNHCTLRAAAAGFSAEQVAQIVVLVMKNQSSQPGNKLSGVEAETLRRIRASCASEQWRAWEVYALRMRALLREQSRRVTPTGS